MLQEFEPHLDCLYSGKGGYDFPEIDTKDGEIYDTHMASEMIKKYAEKNKFCPIEDMRDYSNVKEIVIMGHGLEADLDFIESVFRKAVSLKTIKLFSFTGEPDSEINRKRRMLKEMSNINNIKVLQY